MDELEVVRKERDDWKQQAETWEKRYHRLLKDVEAELNRDRERQSFSNLLLMGLAAIYKREKS